MRSPSGPTSSTDDWSSPEPTTKQTLDGPGRWLLWLGRLPEALIRRLSRIDMHPFYSTHDFPWAKRLEAEADAILSEARELLVDTEVLPAFGDISELGLALDDKRCWKAYFLTAYGARSARGLQRCPKTWKALGAVPGLVTAVFTILEPGAVLPPHRGPYAGVLRLHLGLVIPNDGDVAIRVGNETRRWESGKVLIFDDTYRHSAWNHSAHARVVLFVDFVRPTRFPANAVNRLIIWLARFSPYVRRGARALARWEGKTGARSAP